MPAPTVLLVSDCAHCVQVVDGNRLIETPYDLSFQKDHEHTTLCKRKFNAKEVAQLRKVACPLHQQCL